MNKDILVDTELGSEILENEINKIIDEENMDFSESDFENELNEVRSINSNSGRLCYPIGKNLFNGLYDKTYTAGSSPYGYRSGTSARSAIIKVEPNTTYTISKELSDRFRISQYTEYPIISNSYATSYIQAGDTNLTYTLTTSNTTQYLVIQVSYSNQENIKLQIEQSSTVTSYEPYQGCLYGLELYDMIEPIFITDNYYINCGIIAVFLALIVLIVNAPFLFIRKIRGN